MYAGNGHDGDSDTVKVLARHTALKRWIATEIRWYRNVVSHVSTVQSVVLLSISAIRLWTSSDKVRIHWFDLIKKARVLFGDAIAKTLHGHYLYTHSESNKSVTDADVKTALHRQTKFDSVVIMYIVVILHFSSNVAFHCFFSLSFAIIKRLTRLYDEWTHLMYHRSWCHQRHQMEFLWTHAWLQII